MLEGTMRADPALGQIGTRSSIMLLKSDAPTEHLSTTTNHKHDCAA